MYTIAANYTGIHKRIRQGCKVYLVGGNNGDGWLNRKFLVRFRDGSTNVMWIDTSKIENLRPAFAPKHVSQMFDGDFGMSKEEATELCNTINRNASG